MATITVNGLALQVESSGDGEPVVLVHGSWGDLHSWDALVLPDTLRVIRYSTARAQRERVPVGPGQIADDVADLAALVEMAGPAHVVGNSLGAELALRLAVDVPSSCGRSRCMSLGSGASRPTIPPCWPSGLSFEPVVERLGAGDLEGGTRLFADAILGPDVELPEALEAGDARERARRSWTRSARPTTAPSTRRVCRRCRRC